MFHHWNLLRFVPNISRNLLVVNNRWLIFIKGFERYTRFFIEYLSVVGLPRLHLYKFGHYSQRWAAKLCKLYNKADLHGELFLLKFKTKTGTNVNSLRKKLSSFKPAFVYIVGRSMFLIACLLTYIRLSLSQIFYFRNMHTFRVCDKTSIIRFISTPQMIFNSVFSWQRETQLWTISSK